MRQETRSLRQNPEAFWATRPTTSRYLVERAAPRFRRHLQPAGSPTKKTPSQLQQPVQAGGTSAWPPPNLPHTRHFVSVSIPPSLQLQVCPGQDQFRPSLFRAPTLFKTISSCRLSTMCIHRAHTLAWQEFVALYMFCLTRKIRIRSSEMTVDKR